MVERKVVFPIRLPSCVDFQMHTRDDCALVSLRSAALCQHTALLLCRILGLPLRFCMHWRALSTCGHSMIKGTSEPWVVGGGSPWLYIVPCCIVDICGTAKGPGFPRQPQQCGLEWERGGRGTPLQVVESLSVYKQTLGPTQGVNHDAEMLPSTNIVQ